MSELSRRMGENIRVYRRANRMTLSELAEKINKSKATVGKYEQGAIALDMDTLYEIAAALKVSPFQLMVSLVPEKKEQGEPRLLGERRYLYLYDGRASRILRSLLVSGKEGEDDTVTLFYDIPSFAEPQRCRALYYGHRQKHDFVTNYILVGGRAPRERGADGIPAAHQGGHPPDPPLQHVHRGADQLDRMTFFERHER